jgi:hypothetical protein
MFLFCNATQARRFCLRSFDIPMRMANQISPGVKDVASQNVDRHRRHVILPCGGRE